MWKTHTYLVSKWIRAAGEWWVQRRHTEVCSSSTWTFGNDKSLGHRWKLNTYCKLNVQKKWKIAVVPLQRKEEGKKMDKRQKVQFNTNTHPHTPSMDFYILSWTHGITDSVDMSLSKLQEIVKNRQAWHAQFMGLQTVRQDLSTEQQQQWTQLCPLPHSYTEAQLPKWLYLEMGLSKGN